jgi:6-phosphogluconolactonase
MKFIIIFTVLLGWDLTTQPSYAQEMSKVYNLLIGTYTSGKSNGIYVYSFNAETGDFEYKSEVSGITNPSFLAVTRDRKYVYAVSETGKGQGSISGYSFDPKSGKLTYINSAPSGGDGPCHVAVDDNNQFVFAGNYGGGSLAAIPVTDNGTLSQDIQVIQHQGSSIHKNQNKPRVHATVLSPDNRHLFVPDLGTDKINIYQIDADKAQPLTVAGQPFVKVERGSGPRHFTFHPNKRFAYVIQELNGKITAFKYSQGSLEAIQSVVTTEEGFSGNPSAADIHLSPDGKFLYGSLRADVNQLVIYAVGPDGKLSFVGRQSTLGEHPRNFAIDPKGNYLLVGNGRSDEIVIFRRDQQTGLLTPTGKKISVGSPVCLKFVAID